MQMKAVSFLYPSMESGNKTKVYSSVAGGVHNHFGEPADEWKSVSDCGDVIICAQPRD